MHIKGHASLINKKPAQEYGKEHYRSSQLFQIQEIPDLGIFLYLDLWPICFFILQIDSVYLYDDNIFFWTPNLLVQENLKK